jgi:hypothetical protein
LLAIPADDLPRFKDAVLALATEAASPTRESVFVASAVSNNEEQPPVLGASPSVPSRRRPQFRDQTAGPRLDVVDFIRQHYAVEIAENRLHTGVIHREDLGLYTDLKNWLRRYKLPPDLAIPSKKDWLTAEFIRREVPRSSARLMTILREEGGPKTQEWIRLHEALRKRPL